LAGPNDRLAGPDDRLVGPDDRLAGPDDRLAGPDDRLVGPDDRLVGPIELLARVAGAPSSARVSKFYPTRIGPSSQVMGRVTKPRRQRLR
jgi:hypothetical protein